MIDSPPGQGKTTWAIWYMTTNQTKKFIYCTPYNDEIKRIITGCRDSPRERTVLEPIPTAEHNTKLDSFNSLITKADSIAVTHVTLCNANTTTLENLQGQDYCLILDETIEVISNYNDYQTVKSSKQELKKGTIDMLLSNGMISVDTEKHGLVEWTGKEDNDGANFSEIKRLAKMQRLYYLKSDLFVVLFPRELLDKFKAIYILTYFFKGSLMYPYFLYYGIKYELKSLTADEYDCPCLIEYNSSADREFREKIKKLVTIVDWKKLNSGKSKGQQYCSSWYDKQSKQTLEKINKLLRGYLDKYTKGNSVNNSVVMWTTYEKYKDNIAPKGYKIIRPLTKEEKRLSESELKELENKLSCFVPCNSRATNIYSNRFILAYLCSMNCVVDYSRFFENSIAQGFDSELFNQNYALAQLIQWIMRSRLRNNQTVVLYLPSERMKTLFTEWLNCVQL